MTVQTPTTILFDRNLVQQREYWKKQLRDPDCAAGILPDFPHPSVYDGEINEIHFEPDNALSKRLVELARNNDQLLYAILSGCIKLLIHIYTEAERIAIGSPTRGIDALPNALPIISHIRSEMRMREILACELEVLREAYKHQEWPYERMLAEAGLDIDLPKCRIFDIALILTNLNGSLPEVRNDITITLTRDNEHLAGSISYRPAVYEKRSIERFADLVCRVLDWTVADPGRKVADLNLLQQDEQQSIMEKFNNTVKPFPDDVCFSVLFERQVSRAPQAPALMYEEEVISYHQLNHRVNILASHLLANGSIQNHVVGIHFDRTPEGIAAILAVFKAGGIYLPLDPDYPNERLAFMVNDAQVSLILTDRTEVDWLDDSKGITIINPSTIESESEASCSENLTRVVGPDDHAYLIYTSGSTGIPKGALNSHRGLCNLTTTHIEAFEVTPRSRVLQFASWSFDAMISELAMSLCSGACMCLCPAEAMLPGPPLTEVITTLQITHITLPPAALQYLEPAELPTLSHVVTAGDFCPPEQIARWSSSKVFYNAYGVTEAAVCSTIAPVSSDDTVKGIGRPMANTTIYILDDKKRMMPIGVPGEMYIGGEGVAEGYLNRAELSGDRFMPDPFSSFRSGRMYRTGDRGRFLEDGSIELFGRIDQQIKIRGFRIEPGEIEHILEQEPTVQKAMVLPSLDDSALVAFIEVLGPEPAKQDLIEHCSKYLPYFMVPSSWHILSVFPVNPNGKIDRKALRELADADRERARECAAPRNSLELQLVGIWQEILETSSIGIREDFFELGGHSLLAIRLLALIQHRLSVKMPLAVLIEHPTIEKIAKYMHENATKNIPFTHIVQIQPKGENLPIFCFHPGGGNVQGYLELSRLLGENQPLYGIQASGFDSGQEVITDIETMSQRYMDALRTVQPRGPYALIGWCFGARVAYECAVKLSEQGETVEYLAFLDAYAPHVIPDSLQQSDDATLWESLLAEDTPISAEELRMYKPEEQIEMVIKLAKEADLIPDYYSDEQARNVMKVIRANSRIVQSPITSDYSGRVELFKANEEVEFAKRLTSNPSLGWQDVVSDPVTITFVPGNHNTLVREPHVQTLSDCIKESLRNLRES